MVSLVKHASASGSTKNLRVCYAKEREAVVIPLPVSMPMGQIILLAKELVWIVLCCRFACYWVTPQNPVEDS
jgi:hypothetical protein